ncbi:MAG: MmgE/PrpD family protein, partial [Nocardioides sp.]
MSDPTLSQQLAAFAVDAARNGVPEDVAGSVQQRVLDVLGLCVAAHRLPTSAAAIGHVLDQGGHEQATVVGVPGRVTAAQAAFANGVLAHSLDYDDTHLPSVLHPSASVVPAALAAAEHTGAGGEQAVRAIAVGLEVAVRLGMAGYDEQLGNSVFFEHGQHATSITGAMGSAVAASLLYGADETGIVDALGLTASMASGVIEANRTGGTVKRLHCGLAAQAGVTAAQLVRRGFTGPPTVLEGRFGFFEAWLHGQFFPAAITDGLGVDWSVPGIFFKPYPANHFTHTSIDAGRAFRERGVTPDQVASITIGAPTAVIRTIGQPI